MKLFFKKCGDTITETDDFVFTISGDCLLIFDADEPNCLHGIIKFVSFKHKPLCYGANFENFGLFDEITITAYDRGKTHHSIKLTYSIIDTIIETRYTPRGIAISIESYARDVKF